MEIPTKQIALLARRLAAGTTRAVVDAKQRLGRSDETVARFNAEIRTRRRMMDAALRKKRAK
jgi:hypothetical protein